MADPTRPYTAADIQLVAELLRFEPMPGLAAENVLSALAAAGRLTPPDPDKITDKITDNRED